MSPSVVRRPRIGIIVNVQQARESAQLAPAAGAEPADPVLGTELRALADLEPADGLEPSCSGPDAITCLAELMGGVVQMKVHESAMRCAIASYSGLCQRKGCPGSFSSTSR